MVLRARLKGRSLRVQCSRETARLIRSHDINEGQSINLLSIQATVPDLSLAVSLRLICLRSGDETMHHALICSRSAGLAPVDHGADQGNNTIQMARPAGPYPAHHTDGMAPSQAATRPDSNSLSVFEDPHKQVVDALHAAAFLIGSFQFCTRGKPE